MRQCVIRSRIQIFRSCNHHQQRSSENTDLICQTFSDDLFA
ncbi:hypothetical protein NEISICOT_00900 [Neisseria sicca ATCC 29256]|uniref:Uncharacterized protein n=1 Tax=Neisseria sicca ATCC 29256 TaxID=547045 RepID=C6M309_NEISI|nr:hypothetical protein NEISICOT_00900 [Neisseria sicca ATCC 29256]